jgi:hypothetical protein
MHLESDVDCRRSLVFVLDLGFGQRRTAVETPVDRFEPLVEVALLEDGAERPDFVGLGLEVHCQVGLVPGAENAQPDEVLLLALDLFAGEGAAQLAHAVSRDVLAVQFFDLMLDRQAVAVPARNVGRIESGQRSGADDDVLEDLVDCMADVDVTIGVGRVRRAERSGGGPARPRGSARKACPVCQAATHSGFAPGKVAAHRKRRVGEIEGFLVVGHGGSHNWKYAFTAATSLAICAFRALKSGNFISSRNLCRKRTLR